MKIISAASALPAHVYSQEVITEAFKRHWSGKLPNAGLLERLHARVGVRQRHLAYPMEQYAAFENFGQTNRAWMEAAEEIGAAALDGALRRAGLERDALSALFMVSITGIASPSLDARLINRMGLRTDLKRTPIFGLGCVGGATGLTRAADYVRAYPSQFAAILSVELCSLTIQRDDHSIVNLISIGLFGDGAVAAIMAGAETAFSGPRVVDTRSVFYPGTEEIMGWDISEKGFQVVLSPKLPELIIGRLGDDVDAFLATHELQRRDIGNWIIHPGGPKVLRAVEQALGLRERDLEVSWECLARCGNLSSGSVLMVLEEVLNHRRPVAGTPAMIMAMGPGFCSEMLLVRW
ncbi:MAG: type III polyketide synthase [Candidatus Binataceae bacterium]